MNILLICSAGMSTSLLVTDMKNYLDASTNISAVGYSELNDVIDNNDVILVGPQLRYKLNNIKKIANLKNIPVDIIDPIAYGRIDGKKVVEFAKKLYSEKNGGV